VVEKQGQLQCSTYSIRWVIVSDHALVMVMQQVDFLGNSKGWERQGQLQCRVEAGSKCADGLEQLAA
jgi:hypothetical protein